MSPRPPCHFQLFLKKKEDLRGHYVTDCLTKMKGEKDIQKDHGEETKWGNEVWKRSGETKWGNEVGKRSGETKCENLSRRI